jgi:energy-coupling factor transporter ATP-binding protein EcfA2
MSQHQTIISLRAENTKRLTAIEIHPDGRPMVVLGGRNGQGKSSVLDALTWAFQGKGAMPEQPIRAGEKRATVVAQTQDFIVERRITPSGSTVTVTAADGSALKSPQQVLDRLCSDVAFDPLLFLRGKPKAQAETLAQLTGFDAAGFEAERKRIYDQRTEANRKVKDLEARIQPEQDAPAEEVKVQDLMAELRGARELERRREQAAMRVGELRRGVEEAERRLAAAREALANAVAIAASVPAATVDAASLEQRIADAERLNAARRHNAEQQTVRAALAEARKAAQGYTDALATLDEERAVTLANAALPVSGLAFTADGVTLNGLPLAQASSAEQLRVSVAVALALRPGLRVAVIRDGSLLDAESLALVAQMVGEAGGQVWIERVGTGEEVSVVIEDGAVAEDRMHGPEADEPAPPPAPAAKPAATTPAKAKAAPAPVSDLDLF